MKPPQFVAWQNYQRTLLAVYFLADDDGLCCVATNGQLSAQTGLYVETMKGYLKKLDANGIIRIVFGRKRRRFIVLLDHASAEGFIDTVTEPYRPTQSAWTDGIR